MILIPTFAFAASGSAFVPPFVTSNVYGYEIPITNITEDTITVQFKFFDYNGNLIQDGDNSTSTGVLRADLVDSYYDDPTGASISCQLQAHETGYVLWIPTTPSSTWGSATIEWTQDSTAAKGLIAYGHQNSIQEHQAINGGLPF